MLLIAARVIVSASLENGRASTERERDAQIQSNLHRAQTNDA